MTDTKTEPKKQTGFRLSAEAMESLDALAESMSIPGVPYNRTMALERIIREAYARLSPASKPRKAKAK